MFGRGRLLGKARHADGSRMWRGDKTIFERNGKTMKRANWCAGAFKMLVKILLALQGFGEQDLCQAVGLFR